MLWTKIPVELTPDTSLPAISISYSWNRVSPESMELQITRKVESVVSQLKGVKNIRSSTTEGQSNVYVTFEKSVDIDYRVVELKEYLRTSLTNLPEEVRTPHISKSEPDNLEKMKSFMDFTLSGPLNKYELLEIAEKNIQIPLSGLSGIDRIDLYGVVKPTIRVKFDADKLEQWSITPYSIMSSLKDNFEWQNAGFVEDKFYRWNLVKLPSAQTLNDIQNTKVYIAAADLNVPISAIADVEIVDTPEMSISRFNGNDALSIRILKEAGSDAIKLAEEVQNRIEIIKAELPKSVVLHLENDSTEELREQLNDLRKQAFISFIAVFVLLLLIIRKFRAPIIIIISIVFSIFAAVSALYLNGDTLNIYTMAALTISLGMIVDNAIVVYEHLQYKMPVNRQLRFEYVNERIPMIIAPVIGNTLTTIGIFVPLVFILEAYQYFLMPMGVALSFSLISSVIICLTWIPYALIWFVPEKESNKITKESDSRFRLNRILLSYFKYRYMLRWPITLALIFLIGIPLYLIPDKDKRQPFNAQETEKTELTKTDLLAELYYYNRRKIDKYLGGLGFYFVKEITFGDPWESKSGNQLAVYVRTPVGTSIEELNKIAQNYENIAKPFEYALDYYKTTVDERSGATIVFYVNENYVYKPEPYRLKGEAAWLAAKTGNSNISVVGFGDGFSTGGFGNQMSNYINITGYSYEDLYDAARLIKTKLLKNRRVREVDISYSFYNQNLWQYKLLYNDTELYKRDLNRSLIGYYLNPELNPNYNLGQVLFNNQKMFLSAYVDAAQMADSDLMTKQRNLGNISYKLDEVASLEKETTLPRIEKVNQLYSRRVAFNYLGPSRLAGQLRKKIVDETVLPIGTQFAKSLFSFEYKTYAKEITLVILFAILAVWMIISALLEDWKDSFAILCVMPITLIGVFAGSLYHSLSFGRGAFAGALLLIGVAVNNAILLRHITKHYKEQGIYGFRLWLYTYREKFRSIILTTLTTVVGLLPLTLLNTDAFWYSMATVVIWGLVISTLLIFVVIGLWEKPTLSKSFK